MKEKATFGLDENIACLLCYAFAWITGIIFFVSEKENKKVRFCALQSIIWFTGLMIVSWILTAVGGILWRIPGISILFGLISGGISLLSLVSWIFLMVKAYSGDNFRIPVISDAVDSAINK